VGKPTVKEIEEYMASLNLPEDKFNGTAAYDIVSKPKHYMLFAAEDLHKDKGIEVRDVIIELVNKMNRAGDSPNYRFAPLFISDYVQLMQYLMRFMDKNGVEDLKKARWYLDKMIEAY
jgi:hypothetical protein